MPASPTGWSWLPASACRSTRRSSATTWSRRIAIAARVRDERSAGLARRAAALLDDAGQRALQRSDDSAAVNLLSRSIALLAPTEPRRRELLIDLGDALWETGRLAEADEALAEAIASGGGAADLVSGRAELHRVAVRSFNDPSVNITEQLAVADRWEPIFTAVGDHRGLATVAMARGDVHLLQCHWQDRARASTRAVEHASAVGDERTVRTATQMQMNAIRLGPTPATLGIEQIRVLREAAFGDRPSHHPEAQLLAMLGRFDEARDAIDAARAWLRSSGS